MNGSSPWPCCLWMKEALETEHIFKSGGAYYETDWEIAELWLDNGDEHLVLVDTCKNCGRNIPK